MLTKLSKLNHSKPVIKSYANSLIKYSWTIAFLQHGYSAYCSAVQSIIDQRHHTQSIAYAPEKDPLLQHFEQVQTQLIDDAAQFNPQQYIQQRIQHGFDPRKFKHNYNLV